MPVTPKACAHRPVLTPHGQRHKGRHTWGFAYVWMYTLTHRGTHTDALTCVRSHRDTSPHRRLIPSQGSSQLGHLHFPVTATSIPAQPPNPHGLDPAPAPVCPQLQLPWPSCILSRANPFVDSHCLHPSSSAPVKPAVSSGLLHPISYTLLAP